MRPDRCDQTQRLSSLSAQWPRRLSSP
jgi:hypothetical protein